MSKKILVLVAILLFCGCGKNWTIHCPPQVYVPMQNPGAPSDTALTGIAFVVPTATDSGIHRKTSEPTFNARLVMPLYNGRILFHTDLVDYVSKAMAIELKHYGGTVKVVEGQASTNTSQYQSANNPVYLLNIEVLAFYSKNDTTSLGQYYKEGGTNTSKHVKLRVKLTDIRSGEQIMSEVFEDQIETHNPGMSFTYQKDQCLVLGNYMLPIVLNEAIRKIEEVIANHKHG